MASGDTWLDKQLRRAMTHADAIAASPDHTPAERAAALARIGAYFAARAQAIPPDGEGDEHA